MIDDKGKRTALPLEPAIPPHMRLGPLSRAQEDAFAETDRLTKKADAGTARRGGRTKREAKARDAVKTVAKAVSRSRKDTRARAIAPAPADGTTEE